MYMVYDNRKVHKRLVKTRKDFEDWKEILNKKNTAESREFDPLTRSVSVHISIIASMIVLVIMHNMYVCV